jgi:Xaa-Pro aminopeptidase
LVDLVWATEKPALPQENVFVLDTLYTGLSVQDKFDLLALKLDHTVDALLLTPLDNVAWLLNLRGNDIKFNPVFFAYVLFFPAVKGEEGSKHSA